MDGIIDCVIFEDDMVVTRAEYEEMTPSDVEWHHGVHGFRRFKREDLEVLGVDLAWLEPGPGGSHGSPEP